MAQFSSLSKLQVPVCVSDLPWIRKYLRQLHFLVFLKSSPHKKCIWFLLEHTDRQLDLDFCLPSQASGRFPMCRRNNPLPKDLCVQVVLMKDIFVQNRKSPPPDRL